MKARRRFGFSIKLILGLALIAVLIAARPTAQAQSVSKAPQLKMFPLSGLVAPVSAKNSQILSAVTCEQCQTEYDGCVAGAGGDADLLAFCAEQKTACDVSCTVEPPINFSGFFQPVDNLPTLNVVKAGSAIPVKFSLGGDQGLDIFAAGYPVSGSIDCGTGAPQDAIEVTVTAGNSSLSYNAATDTYTYVWKTEKAWTGMCRQLVVRLNDSSDHVANFKFK